MAPEKLRSAPLYWSMHDHAVTSVATRAAAGDG